jgi:hypothetical protein
MSFLPILPIYLPITSDPRVRSTFQIVQCRTYAHSYHVCNVQGSSANSVGGDSGQDRRTETDRHSFAVKMRKQTFPK